MLRRVVNKRARTPSLLAVLSVAAIANAQQEQPAETFPPDGWQQVEAPATRGPGFARPSVMLREDSKLHVQFRRPKGFVETVVTDAHGVVLARGAARSFTIDGARVGDRYVVYVSQPSDRRCARVAMGFVQFPGDVFPVKGWKPRRSAELRCRDVQQHCAETAREALQEPHRVTFTCDREADDRDAEDRDAEDGEPADRERQRVYLLARCVAGGKDMVVAQSLTPELPFWVRAKRGESFKIYELSPHDNSYRVSPTMTVEDDAPQLR